MAQQRSGSRVPAADNARAEAERAALGSVLIDNGAWWALQEVELRAEDFTCATRSAIFAAMSALMAAKKPVDPVTLAGQLGPALEIVGGLAALVALAEAVPTAANAKHYGAQVKGEATRRALLRAGAAVRELAEDREQSVADIGEAAVNAVLEASLKATPGQWHAAEDAVLEAFKRIETEAENGRPAGLPTGYQPVDEILLGLPVGVHILAARPSMGKTAFLGGVVGHTAAAGGSTGVFLLESTRHAFLERMLSGRSGIPATAIRRRDLTGEQWERMARAAAEISQWPMALCDDTGQSVASIRARCRAMAQQYGDLALVAVDYLQLVRAPEAERRQLQIADILRGFKDLAKDLQAPILLLSQVNRGVDNRPNKRPGLADLREAGDIEQDADIVMFLYREGYYEQPRHDRGPAEVIIAKARDGEVATAELWFEPSIVRFLSGPPGPVPVTKPRAASPGRAP